MPGIGDNTSAFMKVSDQDRCDGIILSQVVAGECVSKHRTIKVQVEAGFMYPIGYISGLSANLETER